MLQAPVPLACVYLSSCLQMDDIPEGPMLNLVLASLDFESLASLYFTNTTLRSLVERYLEIHDYALPGANEALLNSARQGKAYIVEFTLLAGANVHAEKDRALRVASDNGHVDVVRLLLNGVQRPPFGAVLQEGADVHAENDMAILLASRYGNKDTVQTLLKAGTDPRVLAK